MWIFRSHFARMLYGGPLAIQFLTDVMVTNALEGYTVDFHDCDGDSKNKDCTSGGRGPEQVVSNLFGSLCSVIVQIMNSRMALTVLIGSTYEVQSLLIYRSEESESIEWRRFLSKEDEEDAKSRCRL